MKELNFCICCFDRNFLYYATALASSGYGYFGYLYYLDYLIYLDYFDYLDYLFYLVNNFSELIVLVLLGCFAITLVLALCYVDMAVLEVTFF